MFKLIFWELKKIFKHKSIFIIFFLMFLFLLLNNLLYQFDYDAEGNYKYEKVEDKVRTREELKKELSKYKINKSEDLSMYLSIQSELDVVMNRNKYNKNSWQYLKYYDYLYQIIYDINYCTYVEKDNDKLKKLQAEFKKRVSYFENNDYQFFLKLERDGIENNLEVLYHSKDLEKEKTEMKNIEEEIKELKDDLSIINYRIYNHISYGNSYLNKALVSYRDAVRKVRYYEDKDLDYEARLEYNQDIREMHINKYIVDKRINFNKENCLNYQLRTIVSDYELFIVIVVLISAGILIGEEFNKGSIKLLLIRPFKRNRILLAKFIAGFLVMLVSIAFLVFSQMIVGGILFGFGSLKNAVIVYHFRLNKIIEINIFQYMMIGIFMKMPMLIAIFLISSLLGIIVSNTIASFAIGMLIYTFSEVINNMIVAYKLNFLNWFLTINWNFSDYLFGGMSKLESINLKYSVFIYLIYVIMLLVMMFLNFDRKDIKNV